ncbi:RNA-helicase, putative [Plasmodium ovale curtisi]|uniref:RNA-helicase, putative n=1 Tax=Plasmodium ovale curtisi TaxID=864141 RepID=A0A1A8W4F6_PLAOA|nr:RNA-helicase, putative [Plasmodium ovale curtisi]
MKRGQSGSKTEATSVMVHTNIHRDTRTGAKHSDYPHFRICPNETSISSTLLPVWAIFQKGKYNREKEKQVKDMKVRLNTKVKENSYHEYSNKYGTHDIDEVVSYIKKNPFFKRCSLLNEKEEGNTFDHNCHNDGNQKDEKVKQKILHLLRKEKAILIKHSRSRDVSKKRAGYRNDRIEWGEKNGWKNIREKEEKGLMYLHNICEHMLSGKDGWIIIHKSSNHTKKIQINDMNELLTEIIYVLLKDEENIQNGLLNLLSEKYVDLIISIIQNKEEIKKDLKLLSKQIDIKENVLVSNFFITNKTSKKGKSYNILSKKENIEKIMEYFLTNIEYNSLDHIKKIYIPNEENKLEEINVPKNTFYYHSNNVTKVKINRLENIEFDKKELVSVHILPFWHKYIFDFEYFNYIQSKVFKAAFLSNKNLLVSAPTGCGKTNIALLVILQQLILFCEQNCINLNSIAKSYLDRNGLFIDTSINSDDMHRDKGQDEKDHGYTWHNDGDSDNDDDYEKVITGEKKKPFNENASSDSYDGSSARSNGEEVADRKENDGSDCGRQDRNGHACVSAKEFKVIYIAPMKSLVFEITNLFRSKLRIFNLTVCEYTKEQSLTARELEHVHIIVTVPEKLDILLRNSSYSTTISDESLIKCIKCLILDEVHLLNTDRGDVIETIVARFLRYSETSQSVRRIMAMSATLPNYKDVRDFLKVDSDMCFYFNEKYRSIQLEKTLYGIHEKNMHKLYMAKNVYTYNEIISSLKKDKQCIIFVCSRNETNKTVEFLIDYALKNNEMGYFTSNLYIDNDVSKKVQRSNNVYIKRFFEYGCTIHHAGMSRSDKILVENLFKKKVFNVLCCTSTLAWGVNLPVHTVIIKGTNYFSSESGKIEDLDILDINQIFGRCGRPQYESHGHAVLITERTKLYKYIKLLTNNTVIESNFLKNIENHLNAEISIGTTKNVEDGIKWLEYTYLFVRMQKNPYLYDVDLNNDTNLYKKRKEIILQAIQNLSENKLVRRILLTNDFIGTFYGHIAAKYYVDYKTIGIFAANIDSNNYVEIIDVISKAKEFENIQIRNEDMKDFLYYKDKCDIKEKYDESKSMTIRILIEMYVRRIQISNFSLICEINYIVQNIIRILYAYYEICLNILKNMSNLIMNTHNLILSILRRLPRNCGLFRHFCYKNELVDKNNAHVSVQKMDRNSNKEETYQLGKIDSKGAHAKCIDVFYEDNSNNNGGRYRYNQNYTVYLKEGAVNILEKKNLSYESVVNMSRSELFFFLRNEVYTNQILYYRNIIPNLHIDGYIQPITQTIMKINLNVNLQNNIWSDQWNYLQENFHLFLLNTLNNDILYFQKFTIHKKDRKKIHDISFEFPICNQMPPQITAQFMSMNWCNLSYIHIFNTNNLFINQKVNIFSEILPLIPLSTQILKNPNYIKFFSFKYFNPIQTQMFHSTFHTDENILLGAPTGSGKTVIGELCILRNLLQHAEARSVYICPMKAIVSERYKSWKKKFKILFNKNVIEMTGEKNENKENIKNSHIIICTPEKLDVISRNWKNKNFIKNINLIIFDEIHLLGQENRGGVIEILVNRFKNIQNELNKKVRLIGLTTVITSVDDLILWLDVKENYIFNFPSSCRIVPCKTHILGFTQKAYCARMSVMNKNVFDAISQYAQSKNVLIFVSSRRQTRLTGFDIISLNLSSHNLNFLHTENLLNDKNHLKFLQNKGKKKEETTKASNNWDGPRHLDRHIGEEMLHGDYLDMQIPDFTTILSKNLSGEEKVQVQNLILQNYLNIVENEHLKELLKYGIGIHHAGLSENDKNIVEYFFLNKIIQILICTSTLAWGINLPAYLVIIKGNEFYDPKTKKYKDISYTDLLQMIGRAGRPQFDDKALAILLVQEKRKNAIKNFLYHPMNIESNIMENLNEHINAEICSHVIKNKEDMFNYLTKSYYFKRIFSNPSYYIKDIQYVQLFENNKLSTQAKKTIYDHLNNIIDNTIQFLQKNKCIQVIQEDYIQTYYSTPLGHIASVYYIKCETVYFFYKAIEQNSCNVSPLGDDVITNEEMKTIPQCGGDQQKEENKVKNNDQSCKPCVVNDTVEKNPMQEITEQEHIEKCEDIYTVIPKKELTFYGLFELIAQAKEFDDIPLRHNEDKYNMKLRNQIPLDINMNMHNVKTYLLLLSRLYQCTYETVDYHIDLKLVMDQIPRVINGYIDICLLFHKYNYIKNLILILQCINQKIIPTKNSLYIINEINETQIYKLKQLQINSISELIKFDKSFLYSLNIFNSIQLDFILQIPFICINIKLYSKCLITYGEEKKKKDFVIVPCVKQEKNVNKYSFRMKYDHPNEVVIKLFFNFLNKFPRDINSASVTSVQW